MITFNDLPEHLQIHIFEFNPEHRENFKKIHKDLFREFHVYNMAYVLDELIISQTYICDYEYCEAEIPIGEEVAYTLNIPHATNTQPTFHFCNEECCSAGMYWIQKNYRNFLRNSALFH